MGQYYEAQLGAAYYRLFKSCSFEEFYQAYDSCSLVQLFNSKNIDLDQFGWHLADFLANAPYANNSVWDLKQFVVADMPDAIPVPSVKVDYGFLNCRNEEEEVQLKNVYMKFFEEDTNGDPLKLHDACLQGKTYDYIRTTLKLKGKDQSPLFRRLMKNPYPLSQS